MALEKTVERIVPKNFKSREEYLLYLRHIFVYEELEKKLAGSDNVLEIGFGEGYGTQLISKFVDSVIGLDVNQQAVDHANDKYSGRNCNFMHYNGERLPFDENIFDGVVSYQVIEHIEDDEQFLNEIYRVLKKGGSCYLTTPNRLHRLKPGQEPWNSFHIREYDPGQLKRLLLKIFPQVKLSGVNAEPEVHRIETERVKRGITLNKLLPNFLKRFMYGDFTEQYDTNDFSLDKEEVNSGLDLFAKCSK